MICRAIAAARNTPAAGDRRALRIDTAADSPAGIDTPGDHHAIRAADNSRIGRASHPNGCGRYAGSDNGAIRDQGGRHRRHARAPPRLKRLSQS